MKTSLFVLLPFLAVFPARAAAPDFSKIEIKATRIGGNVWMLKGEGGNIAVSAGEDGIALVDDQYAPLAPKIRAALAKLSPKPVRFVINTHFHGDHTGGNAAFAETATLIAQASVRRRLGAGGTRPDGQAIPPAPAAALPIVTFEQGLSLHFNGEEIRAIALQPGHTDGDSAVWFVKSNVVHLGDDYVQYGFPFVDREGGGTVKGMIAALDALVPQLPPDVKIIPGHGEPATLADVRKFARALEEMLAVVKKAGPAADASVLAPWAPWKNDFVPPEKFVEVLKRDVF